jgi:hypothetical protein
MCENVGKNHIQVSDGSKAEELTGSTIGLLHPWELMLQPCGIPRLGSVMKEAATEAARKHNTA